MEVAYPYTACGSQLAAMTPTPLLRHQDSQSWLHGIEGVTKDSGGYVYWHGREIEHFSFGPRDHRDEAMAAKRLKKTCLALEEAGRPVTASTYLDWIRVLATVHVVSDAQFTDMLGCASFYRRAELGSRQGVALRVKRAAMALSTIEAMTGLTARLDNEWHSDPTAVVLVKVSEVVSRESTNAALDDLRHRFLGEFPDDGPRAVAALLQEARYQDGHYVGYVGVRLYTYPFEEHACTSIARTMHVVRAFAQSHCRPG